MNYGISLSFLLAATACLPVDPVISDFNGDSVKLQTTALADIADVKEATQAEAARTCGKAGKRAEYASTRQLPDYTAEHLYRCL